MGTGKGDLIIRSVQLEGKRRMASEEFKRGIIRKVEGKAMQFD